MKAFKPRSPPSRGGARGWGGVPRIVIIPSPVFSESEDVRLVGEALEKHLDVVIAVDDEWKNLIAHSDDIDLALKLKMYILDAISGCRTGIGNVCPAIVLHRSDIALLWLDDDSSVHLLSVKEMVRRKELLYAYDLEPSNETKLFRLQTYRPSDPKHAIFFDRQFENLELEVYEVLYGSSDIKRWRKLTKAAVLPKIAEIVARATRRYVMELCVFDEYNLCPGVLLLSHEDKMDVRILKITSKPENNYIARIDLAGLLASSH
jgi:hypothetical protein